MAGKRLSEAICSLPRLSDATAMPSKARSRREITIIARRWVK
jgi:hypothetical protein